MCRSIFLPVRHHLFLFPLLQSTLFFHTITLYSRLHSSDTDNPFLSDVVRGRSEIHENTCTTPLILTYSFLSNLIP